MKSVILFFFLLFPLSLFSQQRVWIDSDIMIGKFKKDVDDGLALILMLRDSNLQIEGISFVHGVDYADKVTSKLLNWYAPNLNIPTFKGSDDSAGFGKETDAVKAIISALEKGPMAILALGPMTNVGTVLKLRPDLHKNITAISYCAGRKPGILFSPGSGKVKFSDYNFDLDPKSSATLLETEIPVLLSGYDCSDSLFLNREDFIHLKKSKNKGDRWLFRQLKSWENLWSLFLGSKRGFIPFDCSTVGALLYADEFTIETEIPAFIKVDTNDTKYTVSTPTKQFFYVDQDGDGKPVSYCNFTKQKFKKRLLRALNHPEYR
ncbi:MAG TPA: nucleoside hydrolase [Flavobacteriales bacterium]|nr:nucleoside hydrolase [Flavobacteriales bacterium]